MAFQFDKASCIVVGTFNMYIFHPQWLVQREVIDEGTEIGIETNLTQPGFRFRLPKFQATLHVAPTQLVVESLDPNFDCGEVVAKVLAKLPETPVFALGNNAFYKADPLRIGEPVSLQFAAFPVPNALRPANRWSSGRFIPLLSAENMRRSTCKLS